MLLVLPLRPSACLRRDRGIMTWRWKSPLLALLTSTALMTRT
jgi:hypothetical protein